MCLRGHGWSIQDGHFDYIHFYYNIVEMFETDPEDPWVVSTLKWWDG